MKRLLSAVMAAALSGGTAPALAENQFATIEAMHSADGSLVVATLQATADQEPVEGFYIFEGYGIYEGNSVPLTVRVQADEPDVAVAAFSVQEGTVEETFSYSFKAGSTEVNKVFYSVEGQEASGTMSLTDDPLPVVAWLVIAGASSIIIPLSVYITQCQTIGTKATFGTEGMVFETSCER